jgi:hypothetical protein
MKGYTYSKRRPFPYGRPSKTSNAMALMQPLITMKSVANVGQPTVRKFRTLCRHGWA